MEYDSVLKRSKEKTWKNLKCLVQSERSQSENAAHCMIPTILHSAAAAAKSHQSCPTLRPGSPPGSPVPGILQARTLEWVAISFSNAWKWIVKVKSLSRVRLLATPWTAAHQAPRSMGFSRQECWSGVPLPSLILHSRKGKAMVTVERLVVTSI